MSDRRDLTEGYQYLMRIRWKENAIRIKQMRIDALHSCLGPKAITYDGDRVQTSPEDRMTDVLVLIEELDREVKRLRKEKAALINEVGDMIDRLSDESERGVLMGFYVAGYRMSRVAEEIGYSRSQAYEIRTRAVEHLMDML